MSRIVQCTVAQIRPTDVPLTDPVPADPAALVTVERPDAPAPTPPPAVTAPTVDPVEYARVRDLALALADLQPANAKAADPVRAAAEKLRGKRP